MKAYRGMDNKVRLFRPDQNMNRMITTAERASLPVSFFMDGTIQYTEYNLILIVSTGGIQWILWFSVRYATATAHREIFGVDALRGKLHQLGSPNLQDIFIGG